MSYADQYDPTDGIAIVGMAGRFPGANSVGERTASVVALREIEVMVARETFKAMARKASEAPVSKAAAVMAARDFAKRLGINLTKRKLAQAIPVVGLVVGAATNGMFLGDVGWAARRSYQSRLLAERRAAPAEVAA